MIVFTCCECINVKSKDQTMNTNKMPKFSITFLQVVPILAVDSNRVDVWVLRRPYWSGVFVETGKWSLFDCPRATCPTVYLRLKWPTGHSLLYRVSRLKKDDVRWRAILRTGNRGIFSEWTGRSTKHSSSNKKLLKTNTMVMVSIEVSPFFRIVS